MDNKYGCRSRWPLYRQQLLSHWQRSRLQHSSNSRPRQSLWKSNQLRRLRAQVCHHRMVSVEMNFDFAIYHNSHANLSHYIFYCCHDLRAP